MASPVFEACVRGACAPAKSQLEKLFVKFIEDHWKPEPNQRNEFIVRAVPFLYHAMCERAVRALVMNYHKVNRSLFNDGAEQHKEEARFHMDAHARKWLESISDGERAMYDRLRNERERATFRICRHLSRRVSRYREDCEGDQFILVYEDLANRLLIDPKAAYRIMRDFKRIGVVELVRNGERRRPGMVKPRGSVWRYCLHDPP